MTKKLQMIFLLLFGYTIVFIDKTIIGFALIPIEKQFSLSTEQLGYISGLFFLSYSLFQIPAGWLNDRIGYKKMVIASLSLLGLFAFMFGILGVSFGLLLLFRFLSGIGHSGYPASCAKAVVSNFSIEHRTFAQSILLSSSGLAMTTGPIIAVYAMNNLGWQISFSGLGLIACATALLIFLIIPRQSVVPQKENIQQWNCIFKYKAVIWLFISVFFVNIPNYGMLAWLPKFLVQHLNMPIQTSGYVIAAGGLGIWISSLLTGWLVGKYFSGKEVAVIVTCASISSVCIFCIFHMTSPLGATVFLFIGQVFLMSTFVTVFTLPMKQLPENIIGSTMGFINTGGTLGGFVSPVVIGYLVSMTDSYYSVFIFLTIAMLFSGLATLPLLRKTHVITTPSVN